MKKAYLSLVFTVLTLPLLVNTAFAATLKGWVKVNLTNESIKSVSIVVKSGHGGGQNCYLGIFDNPSSPHSTTGPIECTLPPGSDAYPMVTQVGANYVDLLLVVTNDENCKFNVVFDDKHYPKPKITSPNCYVAMP